MTDGPCDRFETEGLHRLEQGKPLDPHFATCPSCLQARARIEHIAAEIGGLGDHLEPSGDWQAKTWARIEQRRSQRSEQKGFSKRLRWLAPAGTGAVLVAALIAVVALRMPSVPPGLEATLLRGETTMRGLEASPGDLLTLRAPADAVFAELRIYRNDAELVSRCSTAAPCHRRHNLLEATFTVPGTGTYQVLLLRADQPLPAPTGNGLDADAERALAAGARVELGDDIEAR